MIAKSNKGVRERQVAHFDREVIMAKVEDWLPSRVGVKILKIVNGAGGIAFVNDDQDQLKIMFPEVRVSSQDPRKVLGLILDRDKGWVVCSFIFSRDDARASKLTEIIKQIGFTEDRSLLASIYRLYVSAPQDQSAGEMFNVINLLVKVTRFDQK